MTDFKKLLLEVSNLNDKETDEYLLNFFTKNNFKNYEIDALADKTQVKAIKKLFDSKKQFLDRVEDSLQIDPFCKEAILIYLLLAEDVFISYRFNSYLELSSDYADFDEYEKKNYLQILDLYVDFLLDIHNITTAIRVQRLIIRLSSVTTRKEINRLSFMYSTIENHKDFYRLYLDNEFDTYDFILLLITLLKNDEELKAREVLDDMFDKIEYSTYLDHLWDLDLNDTKQREFYETVEDCYIDISSIPDFFSWVARVREDSGEA